MIEAFKEWIKLLSSFDFWLHFIERFRDFGPIAPIFLAMIESLIPALPLVAIVTFNITAYGMILGFLYSWIGSMLGCFLVFSFFRFIVKKYLSAWIKHHHAIQKGLAWVARVNYKILFIIALLPFTPSSFLNIVFGLSDFDIRLYFKTLMLAKIGMILSLSLFGSSVVLSFENPYFLIIAALILLLLYWLSKYFTKKHGLK